MIKKRKMTNNKYRVTFSMPALEGVTQLHLVGEFNDWSETATPMQKADDGSWSAKLTLEGNREYQYRYLADNGQWHNDWAADAYVRNEFGADNSVVSLIAGESPRKKIAARKKLLL
ncbi:MAG: glycoside hydrolase [Chloroflexi bacterium]|nr:glycoside hydrolase [Chloroflexota bacterium]